MLRATFQHLVRGISAEKEAALWRQGILTWEDFEKRNPLPEPPSDNKGKPVQNSLFSAPRAALCTGNAAFFSDLLNRREHFRIPLTFPEKTIFLDIETTGLSRYYDIITLVGWSSQGSYGVFVRGQDDAGLREIMRDAQVIVTFNGSLFDLPFLRAGFPDLKIPPVHIDLRFLAKRVGLSGGQKSIEQELGIKRPSAVLGIRGDSAPVLWHKYRRGSLDALKLLIEYNHCDIEGMKYILDDVVARLFGKLGIPRRIQQSVPRFAKPRKLILINGKERKGDSAHAIQMLPYLGSSGPEITLSDLLPRHASDSLRIVGIDLTGSENRLTGWCLLRGKVAITRTLRTDEELVAATVESHAHLVSIDSPLSLPTGRISVFDDDPGRREFGIMRTCERVLKQRGINVYPTLIPSMQRLTERGIRLATRLRGLGIPVIESYPGAAQDIMGIPRKRASLEMLREGLAEFGVAGEYMNKKVTHDELDAITSAVVGAFFWSGKFEALGTGEEEALIIPDLKATTRRWQDRRMIGISGPVAAGKTSAARHLQHLGFFYARYSMVLESILKARGEHATREDLQKFGELVHNECGQRWLGRRLLETLPQDGDIVIDGLRFPEDHAFLAETFGPAFRHVHIRASVKVRNARFRTRERGGRGLRKAQKHPVEQKIDEVLQLSHTVITNEDSIQSLRKNLDMLVYTNHPNDKCRSL